MADFVITVVWDRAGIKVWFFSRDSIPSDISNDSPDPTGWGTPMANFPSDDCSPYTYFYDHYNIFDTTLCGDWAGASSVWNYAGYAGQDQSCAALTGSTRVARLPTLTGRWVSIIHYSPQSKTDSCAFL